ncbi:MAG: hypothetical protein H7X91_09435 [Burkholderiales bacterium]|nr:hypothetical protein [Burkholderiales bacterium]
MAKPNYAFAKRQKELAKLQKKEEKQKRKAEANSGGDAPPQEAQTQPENKTPG